jgi:lipopolysaccharide transport system ATP-binding protein
VGDLAFQQKCVDKIWDYKRRGKTMFFCSHSLYDVRQICERAIWLREGRVQLLADAVTVTNEYATWDSPQREARDRAPYEQLPGGGDGAHPRIVEAHLVDPQTGALRNTFAPGETVAVRLRIRNSAQPVRLAVAVGVMRSDGTLCFAHSSQLDGITFDHGECVVTCRMPALRLLSGEFNLPVWLLDERGVHRHHERPVEQKLVVQNRTKDLGLFLQDHEWRIEPIPPGETR